MTNSINGLTVLPCLDSAEMASLRRRELDIPRDMAARLGRSALEVVEKGFYINAAGRKVDLGNHAKAATAANSSIPPDDPLPVHGIKRFSETRVQVTNETTLGASLRLVESNLRPLALNFANGVEPGGGFLSGARAQEEVLCRSSALFQTLVNDPMYEEHSKRQRSSVILEACFPTWCSQSRTGPGKDGFLARFVKCFPTELVPLR